MIEVNTLSFRLRLEKKSNPYNKYIGNYYYVLFCESPFDVSKNFSEEFFGDFNSTPFYTFSDAIRFAGEMADFWASQINNNPKLDITRLEELTDVWKNISVKLNAESTASGKKELSLSH